MKVGCDIQSLSEFRESCKTQGFLEMLFTERELATQKNVESLCGKFCAKEAVVKALGAMPVKDIEIMCGSDGVPMVSINGVCRWDLKCSISHSGEYAVAMVVVE